MVRETEPAIFTYRTREEIPLVGVYVDNLVIVSNNPERVEKLKAGLAKEFWMKNRRETKYCLGLNSGKQRASEA